jgi:hypothetical protein
MLGSLGLVVGMVVAPAPALAHDVDPADFQQVTPTKRDCRASASTTS